MGSGLCALGAEAGIEAGVPSEAPATDLGFLSNFSVHQKELIPVPPLTDVVIVKNFNGFCESVCK